MVPLIELRGSIPVGLSPAFGPAFSGTTQVLILYAVSILGNMLPVPIIFFFARKVLVWGSDKKFIGKFFKFCLEKGEKVEKSYLKKLVVVFTLHYFFSWEFLFLELVRGLEL